MNSDNQTSLNALNETSFASIEITFRTTVLASDRAEVERIVAATGFFRPDEIEIAVELIDEYLAKGIESGYQFVFVDNGDAVAGYGCFGEIPCTIGSFDLYWIAVDPAAQGLGLGKKILAEVERQVMAQGGRHVYIETSGQPQYASTNGFYQRCGYEIIAVMPEFYDVGDDKVVWRKVVSR